MPVFFIDETIGEHVETVVYKQHVRIGVIRHDALDNTWSFYQDRGNRILPNGPFHSVDKVREYVLLTFG